MPLFLPAGQQEINVKVEDSIRSKVEGDMEVLHLELSNESHRHAGPATDSHFKLTLVSSAFAGLSAVKRHQRLYRLLAAELGGPVHALALHLYTPEEWLAAGHSAPASPDCRGGSKAL